MITKTIKFKFLTLAFQTFRLLKLLPSPLPSVWYNSQAGWHALGISSPWFISSCFLIFISLSPFFYPWVTKSNRSLEGQLYYSSSWYLSRLLVQERSFIFALPWYFISTAHGSNGIYFVSLFPLIIWNFLGAKAVSYPSSFLQDSPEAGYLVFRSAPWRSSSIQLWVSAWSSVSEGLDKMIAKKHGSSEACGL